MGLIEQYGRFGLTRPIVFRAGLRMHSAVGRWRAPHSWRRHRDQRRRSPREGVRPVTALAEAGESYDQFAIEMERIRRTVQDQPDATILNIPVPLRFGMPVDDLVAIINREVAARHR